MNLSPYRIGHRYFKIFVVAEAFVAPVLGKLLAVDDRFGVSIELNASLIPHRNAIFHIEQKLLHGIDFGCGVSGEPRLVSEEASLG